MELPVPAEAVRRDGSLILHLRFPTADVVPGDSRPLTIACSGIEIAA